MILNQCRICSYKYVFQSEASEAGDQFGKVGGPTLYMSCKNSLFNGTFYFSYTKMEPNGKKGEKGGTIYFSCCCGLSYNRIHRSCTLYLLEHSFYLFPYKVLRNTCNSVLSVLGVRCVCSLFTCVRCCRDCINL